MAADFQLLEADHARRRELVDQLSTTVELVEDENRKLHKVSSNMSICILSGMGDNSTTLISDIKLQKCNTIFIITRNLSLSNVSCS